MAIFPDANILDINLSTGKIELKKLDGETYRLYPGGSALGMYLILQEIEKGVEPLSPENLLIFSASPLTGLPISGQSRVVVTTKSPLTGGITDTQAGGFFPAHLKANGYDGVVIRGRAEKPVYIYIGGEKVEIRAGSNVWGKVTGEAERLIKEEIGDSNLEIAQIGPAGENMVMYANIINMCNRANGRGGTGAVMGSKNLKALVVKKSKSIKPYDIENFKNLTKNMQERIKNNGTIKALKEHGTDVDLEGFSSEGFLPTRNWISGYFKEGAEKITGTTMIETILKERDTCYACAIRCKRVVEVKGKVDPLYGGPEYETCSTFGSYCGVSDLEAISLANQLCNMYGIDTISCGATISFAMECFESGLINKGDTDGIELNFGNADAVPIIIEKIAKREGLGNLLAEGSARAARIIGKGAEKFSMSVKGRELPAHMPQYKPSLGVIYAVNPFGADHQSSEHDGNLLMPPDSQERRWLSQVGALKGYDNMFELDDDKVRFAFDSQCFYSMLDTLCLCQFAWGPAWQLYGPSDIVSLCRFGIGWETSIFELMRIGERRINMMRFFNEREGFTKADDTLPERIFEPLPDGPSKGRHLDKEEFEKAKELYYKFAGWDEKTGNPREDTLRKLSLGWLLERK